MKNRWFLAALAVVVGVGTQAGYYFMRLNVLLNAHAEAPHEDVPAPTFAPATLDWNFMSPAVDQLRDELEKRLADAARRMKELEEYESRLASERGELEKLKQDLEQRRRALDAKRTEFLATLLEVREDEEKNLKTLASTYSTLAPGAALAIFKEMDDDAVVKILAYMKPDPVGQILQEMTLARDGGGSLAARAAAISNKLRLKSRPRAAENP